ncbi:hypothetical protein IEE94_11260 [Yimella sp. cx-573]|nr:hypothetical protein [Yimella sp. cx-573]
MIPQRARGWVYVLVGIVAVVLLVLAVVSPEHYGRLSAAVGPVVALVATVLARLHLGPTDAETAAVADPESPTGAVAGPASDVPDGAPVQVIPGTTLDIPESSDPKADAAYYDPRHLDDGDTK